MWFLTAGPVVSFPMILAELLRRKALREFLKRSITFTNKFNSLTFTVASSLVRTSPLAVITVVGLLDVLMVSISAELRSFLLTMCILATGINHKPSFLQLFFVGATGSTHSSAGEQNAAFVFLLERVYVFLTRFHALLRAHRSCLPVSSSNFRVWGLR